MPSWPFEINLYKDLELFQSMNWSEFAIINGLSLLINFSASKVVQAAPSVKWLISINENWVERIPINLIDWFVKKRCLES